VRGMEDVDGLPNSIAYVFGQGPTRTLSSRIVAVQTGADG